jgi:hypothetical protein
MEDHRQMNPKIISAVDLTHLQPQERVSLIGSDNLRTRREFLEKLLKAGIVVGLPMMMFSPGCKPDIVYKATDEEDCPNYTPCNQNVACSCQSDSLANIPPLVVNTVPAQGSTFTLDPNGVEIRIDIDKALEMASVAGALTLLPAPSGGFDIHFYDLSKNKMGFMTSLALCASGTTDKIKLLPDTTYTVTLKGSVKGLNGRFLDGNSDGVGGEDFSFSFTTVKKYDPCVCQSDCSCVGYSCSCQSYSSCSCQSYSSCTCQSNTCYYCECQFAACTLYRI